VKVDELRAAHAQYDVNSLLGKQRQVGIAVRRRR